MCTCERGGEIILIAKVTRRKQSREQAVVFIVMQCIRYVDSLKLSIEEKHLHHSMALFIRIFQPILVRKHVCQPVVYQSADLRENMTTQLWHCMYIVSQLVHRHAICCKFGVVYSCEKLCENLNQCGFGLFPSDRKQAYNS